MVFSCVIYRLFYPVSIKKAVNIFPRLRGNTSEWNFKVKGLEYSIGVASKEIFLRNNAFNKINIFVSK